MSESQTPAEQRERSSSKQAPRRKKNTSRWRLPKWFAFHAIVGLGALSGCLTYLWHEAFIPLSVAVGLLIGGILFADERWGLEQKRFYRGRQHWTEVTRLTSWEVLILVAVLVFNAIVIGMALV